MEAAVHGMPAEKAPRARELEVWLEIGDVHYREFRSNGRVSEG